MRQTTTISSRVERGIKDAVDEFSNKTGKSTSKLVKDALMTLLKEQDAIEMDENLEKVVERYDTYIKTENELLFIDMENKRVSATYRSETFPSYMDSFLADIYVTESRDEWKSHEEIKETLQEALETLKERAKHHEKMKEWENRYNAPIHYAQKELDFRNKDTGREFDN